MTTSTDSVSDDPSTKRGLPASRARMSLAAGRGVRQAAIAVLLPLAVIILWQAAGQGGSLFGGVLPTPDRVWKAWVVWAFGPSGGFNASSGTWLANLLFSAERVTKGFACAIIVGVPVGVMIGWSRAVSGAFDPTVQLLRPIPITACLAGGFEADAATSGRARLRHYGEPPAPPPPPVPLTWQFPCSYLALLLS